MTTHGRQVFDATRIKPLAGAKSFISENIGTGAELVGGYLKGERRSLDELPAGEAAIVKLNGERTAVFRDERGELHAVSAVCTHMGCVLGWNSVDRTWDCSCHGSRFALDGSRAPWPRDDRLGANSRLLTEQEAGFDAAPAPRLPVARQI